VELAALVALARSAAREAGLDPALVCAVCEQESSWNPWAVRYEPLFYARYIAPLVRRGVLADATEARARAFSWGLMQVMGQTAREQGWRGPLPQLCEPATGLSVGCRRLAALLAKTGDPARALAAWNGGARPDYAARVLARRARYA
jgi:soluble lytic murein transglycosylase-like protein